MTIDIDSGDFEVDDDSLTAAKQLLARCPNAQIFGIRIAHRAVHRFGFRFCRCVVPCHAVVEKIKLVMEHAIIHTRYRDLPY